MPQTIQVNVPGIGVVEFPAGAKPEDMKRAIDSMLVDPRMYGLEPPDTSGRSAAPPPRQGALSPATVDRVTGRDKPLDIPRGMMADPSIAQAAHLDPGGTTKTWLPIMTTTAASLAAGPLVWPLQIAAEAAGAAGGTKLAGGTNAEALENAAWTAGGGAAFRGASEVGKRVAPKVALAVERAGDYLKGPSSGAAKVAEKRALEEAAYASKVAGAKARDTEAMRFEREKYDARQAKWEAKQDAAEATHNMEQAAAQRAASGETADVTAQQEFDRLVTEARNRRITAQNSERSRVARENWEADKAVIDQKRNLSEAERLAEHEAAWKKYQTAIANREGQAAADEANRAAQANYDAERAAAREDATAARNTARSQQAQQQHDIERGQYEQQQATKNTEQQAAFDEERAAFDAKQKADADAELQAFINQRNQAAETQARIAAMMPDQIVTDVYGPRPAPGGAPPAPVADTGLGNLMPPPVGPGRSVSLSPGVEPPPLVTRQFELPSQAMRDVQQQGQIVSALKQAGLAPPPESIAPPPSLPSGVTASPDELAGFVPSPREPFAGVPPTPNTTPFPPLVEPVPSILPRHVPKPQPVTFQPPLEPPAPYEPGQYASVRPFVEPAQTPLFEVPPPKPINGRALAAAEPFRRQPFPEPFVAPKSEAAGLDPFTSTIPDYWGPKTKGMELLLKGGAGLLGLNELRRLMNTFGGP